GEPRGFTPHRCERGVKLDHRLVSENLDPAHAVRVRPHRVVDASEIRGEMSAAIFEKVRKQETHLVMRERVLARPQRFIPDFLRLGLRERSRDELIPHVWRDSAFGADASRESVQEVESSGYLPTAQVAGSCAAPDVRSESRTGSGDLVGDLNYLFC